MRAQCLWLREYRSVDIRVVRETHKKGSAHKVPGLNVSADSAYDWYR